MLKDRANKELIKKLERDVEAGRESERQILVLQAEIEAAS